jgi:hypothetical protein
MPVDAAMRRAYRQALLEAERTGAAEPPNPYHSGGSDAFLSWLGAPADDVPDDGRISRYLLGFRAARADLRAVFPEVPGRHSEDYLAWVQRAPGYGEQIPLQFVPA